ncbi:unnamed protein product, partial [Rotaria sp. Silwood2]
QLRIPSSDCVLPSSTARVSESIPIWTQNLQPSSILSVDICLEVAIALRCFRGADYVLAIIEPNYATTGIGQYEIPTSIQCHQDTSLGLTCIQSCFTKYDIPKPLVQFVLLDTDYINIDYQCIPTCLPNNENPI